MDVPETCLHRDEEEALQDTRPQVEEEAAGRQCMTLAEHGKRDRDSQDTQHARNHPGEEPHSQTLLQKPRENHCQQNGGRVGPRAGEACESKEPAYRTQNGGHRRDP
jgi:hypothetical protein